MVKIACLVCNSSSVATRVNPCLRYSNRFLRGLSGQRTHLSIPNDVQRLLSCVIYCQGCTSLSSSCSVIFFFPNFLGGRGRGGGGWTELVYLLPTGGLTKSRSSHKLKVRRYSFQSSIYNVCCLAPQFACQNGCSNMTTARKKNALENWEYKQVYCTECQSAFFLNNRMSTPF